MVKSVNSSMFSYFIFVGGSLSIATTMNMEGTEERTFVPVIFSIVAAIWFIKKNYENYMGFYLDKEYAKKIFFKNSMFALAGYLISLILSFVNMRIELYDYVIFIGLAFSAPAINTMTKMFLRLKEIRDSIGKEDYNYFILKKE